MKEWKWKNNKNKDKNNEDFQLSSDFLLFDFKKAKKRSTKETSRKLNRKKGQSDNFFNI